MHVGLIVSLAEVYESGIPQPYTEVRELVRHAEATGVDTAWFADHLLGMDATDIAGSPWEAWSVLCALAEATSTIRLGTLVLCTAFRPPSVLARMGDTLADISDGRLVLGLGAGWYEAEFRAFGLPFDYRVGRFSDALRIISGMLRSGRDTFAGPFHSIRDAPVRLRPGRHIPPILVAGRQPRMLRLTAEFADMWNLAWYGLPDENYTSTSAALTNTCERIGRDPRSLARTVGIRIAPPGAAGGPDPLSGRLQLPGKATAVAEALSAWRAEDMAEVVCWVERCDRSGVDMLAEAIALHRKDISS